MIAERRTVASEAQPKLHTDPNSRPCAARNRTIALQIGRESNSVMYMLSHPQLTFAAVLSIALVRARG